MKTLDADLICVEDEIEYRLDIVAAMTNLPPDTRALRQTIYAGVVAFILGFVVALAALGWLVTRLAAPDSRWWEILHVSIYGILISVFSGLLFATAAAWGLS